jgi:hypothetical protein
MKIYSALDDIYAEQLNPNWKWYNDEKSKEPIPEGPYYHGTTVPNLTHVLPASQTKNKYTHDGETDPNYTYATPDIDDAWEYATGGGGAGQGRPHVYEVEPLGGHESLEHDPPYDESGRYRWTAPQDLRSNKGFRVVREVKTPSHIRQNYSDEEWNQLGEKENNNANSLRAG